MDFGNYVGTQVVPLFVRILNVPVTLFGFQTNYVSMIVFSVLCGIFSVILWTWFWNS